MSSIRGEGRGDKEEVRCPDGTSGGVSGGDGLVSDVVSSGYGLEVNIGVQGDVDWDEPSA